MTTATPEKRKSVSAELQRLQEKRDELHRKVLAAKEKVNSWQEEHAPTYVQQAHIENPHQAELDRAMGPYLQADEELQRFKIRRVADRIAEIGSQQADDAIETMRDGFEAVRRGAQEYAVVVEEVRSIVIDTDGLNGQHLGHDPRPAEWAKLAAEALDAQLVHPGLTAVGAARAEQLAAAAEEDADE